MISPKLKNFPIQEVPTLYGTLDTLLFSSAIKMKSNNSSPKLKALKKCWTRLTVECDNFESIQLNIVTVNLLIRYAQPIPVSQSQIRRFVEYRWMGALIARVTLSVGGISEIFRVDCATILNWFDGFFYWFLISQFSVWVAQLPRLPRGAPVSLMKFKFSTRIMQSAYEILQNATLIQIEIQIHIFEKEIESEVEIDRLTRGDRRDGEWFEAW